jgi:hypothetical protein
MTKQCEGHALCKSGVEWFDSNTHAQLRDDLVNKALVKKQKVSRIRSVPQLMKDQKVVATEFSLGFWQCQTYGIDLTNWPRMKPEHLSKDQYEGLKKQLRGILKAKGQNDEVRVV